MAETYAVPRYGSSGYAGTGSIGLVVIPTQVGTTDALVRVATTDAMVKGAN